MSHCTVHVMYMYTIRYICDINVPYSFPSQTGRRESFRAVGGVNTTWRSIFEDINLRTVSFIGKVLYVY